METQASAKEELKRTIDIVELVGQFVQLKRTGQNFLGLCPFHAEKTPSFTVSPSKQMFHCFGCRKGGDIFAFWMEYHKTSFSEALRDLSERYGVPLPSALSDPSERGDWTEKRSLQKVNEKACVYFHRVLVESPKGKPARDYLKRRGITQEVISRFKLGYAPDEWDGLCSALKGEDLRLASKAGLVIPRGTGGHYDRFRSRVMYPIFDVRGRVLGFGGRVLDDSLPKYLNTPESPLFHKGRVLYGLHASQEAIRQSGRAVFVEGYMDLLALQRHGFSAVVATLGTALSREHVRMIKGYAKEAVVVFDSDSAGKVAASRSLPCFLEEGFPAKVLLLPENEDPDTFVNKNGLESFLNLLEGAVPLFDFFVDSKFLEAGGSIEGQVTVLREILPLLQGLGSPTQRAFYVRRLAERMGVPESSVLSEMARLGPSRLEGERHGMPRPGTSDDPKENRNDTLLLNLLVHHPDALDRLMNEDVTGLISDPRVGEIFRVMTETRRKEGRFSPAALAERLPEGPAKQAMREALMGSSIFSREELEQALQELVGDRLYRLKLAQMKRKALEAGDFEQLSQIPKKKREKWG